MRSPDTKLTTVNLPYWDVVLTERFLLPPQALARIGERVPETVGEISAMAGLPIDDVNAIIDECIAINDQLYLESIPDGIFNQESSNHESSWILVDMRPEVDACTEPLHPQAKLFHYQNPSNFLTFLRQFSHVVVISDHDDHAWSAAASLRKMGIKSWLCKNFQFGAKA